MCRRMTSESMHIARLHTKTHPVGPQPEAVPGYTPEAGLRVAHRQLVGTTHDLSEERPDEGGSTRLLPPSRARDGEWDH